jgi:hypothetical protein
MLQPRSVGGVLLSLVVVIRTDNFAIRASTSPRMPRGLNVPYAPSLLDQRANFGGDGSRPRTRFAFFEIYKAIVPNDISL